MDELTNEELLKASLENTLNALIDLRRNLYAFDAHLLQNQLEETEHSIRPLLSIMRTPEERREQKARDRRT